MMRGRTKLGVFLLGAAVLWGAGDRKYWAFQKPVRPEAPGIHSPWIRTPIDAFILDALREKKLTPSAPLDRGG